MVSRGIRHFSKVASAYDRPANARFYSAITERLLELVPDLPVGDSGRLRVLDFGGGSGFSTLVLLERFPAADLTAFEPSQPMAAAASARLSGSAAKVVTELGDSEDVHGFQLVCASMSLHWGAPESFDAVTAMTSPGGLAVIALPAPLHKGALGNRILVRAIRDVIRESDGSASGRRASRAARGVQTWTPKDVMEALPGFATVTALRLPFIDETPAEEFAQNLHSRGAFAAFFDDEASAEAAFERARLHADTLSGEVSTVWPVTLWVGRRR